MRDLVWLAWKYVAFHRWKTAVSVFAVSLCIFTPLAVELIVAEFERSLADRSKSTPLVIGSKGSRLDLAFHAMHFETSPPTNCTIRDWRAIFDAKLAVAIPLHCRFTAGKIPIVGTSLDYWDFRGLRIARGLNLQRLGDCVLGSSAAKKLNRGPGDRLLSDPENVFDLVGSYPLDMRVVGVLAQTDSPDDNAVFVDVKTSWIIAGLGHGHVDAKSIDAANVLTRSENEIVVAPSVVQFTKITDANVSRFHFHGDEQDLPLTAIIAAPHDSRSEALLEGKFLDPKSKTQVVRPGEVFNELMTIVVRLKELIQLVGSLLIVTTVLYLLVVVALTRKLRQQEFATLQSLGCSRRFVIKLQVLELGIVLLFAVVVASCTLTLTHSVTSRIVSLWLATF